MNRASSMLLTKNVGVQNYVNKPFTELKIYRGKIKNLNHIIRRKSKKIQSMKDLINHLKKNSKCDTDLEE